MVIVAVFFICGGMFRKSYGSPGYLEQDSDVDRFKQPMFNDSYREDADQPSSYLDDARFYSANSNHRSELADYQRADYSRNGADPSSSYSHGAIATGYPSYDTQSPYPAGYQLDSDKHTRQMSVDNDPRNYGSRLQEHNFQQRSLAGSQFEDNDVASFGQRQSSGYSRNEDTVTRQSPFVASRAGSGYSSVSKFQSNFYDLSVNRPHLLVTIYAQNIFSF